jgi:dihydrofolate reductase
MPKLSASTLVTLDGVIQDPGSATLVQTLMRHNLIDEYRIHVHPIVLGGGTQLFPQGGVPATLRLTGTHTLDSGVVSLTYVPAGRAGEERPR